MDEAGVEERNATAAAPDAGPALSKSARKKLAKQQRLEARKAERKAAEKERRRRDVERRRREWEETLAAATEEERAQMIGSRREARRERVERRGEEREMRALRLRRAAEVGPKVVLDLEFSDLMTPNEIHSLVQQIMYCYAVNGRCASPAHLWLTGCQGELDTHLQRLPGYYKWIIEKESRSYIEAFQEQKDNLVYLTADSETTLEEIDQKKIYIIGGLVDRNRWKGVTMKKANEQGIHSAKLPIGNYLKMSSSQVLTVNQVFEILLKFIETKDWKDAFFQVIPQRKRGELEAQTYEGEDDETLATAIGKLSEDEVELESAEEDGIVLKKPRTIEAEVAATTDGVDQQQ
ncbi:tRNA (guanine(9)-N1)-methyltransferase isoform X1 [Musa acuminata AAA Group]|uniref:tRNA (guanine(9)-N1)-methyltransferase isoform X1 n=1 Tax=Musa acuminata AAA Group TaxID=214697 RepID=UPI0031DCF4C2